jgi:hypothetical protein
LVSPRQAGGIKTCEPSGANGDVTTAKARTIFRKYRGGNGQRELGREIVFVWKIVAVRYSEPYTKSRPFAELV